VGLLCLAVLAPIPVRAATDLTLGGVATVAYTEGGFVLLRTEPSWNATVLTSLPEGTVVDVLDGPLYSPDGSPWYAVIAWGQEGFLPAAFLVSDGSTAAADAKTDAAVGAPGAAANDPAVASDYVAARG
jgi:hypothetical protein